MSTTYATRPARANRYGGNCQGCGHYVPAEAGELTGSRAAGWGVRHHDGECLDTAAPAPATAEAKAGYYVQDDEVFVVVISKSSGKPYAKRLVVEPTAGHHVCGIDHECEYDYRFGGECGACLAAESVDCTEVGCTPGRNVARWEYAPGIAGRVLAALEPLTVEEAARLGHLHGVCVICCKQLTDPKSVERGIGPVCAAKL